MVSSPDLSLGDPAFSDSAWTEALLRLPIPVLIHDESRRCLAANARFTELTGYTVADIPDLRAWAMRVRRIPESEIEDVLRVADERYAQPVAPQREMTVYAKDGRRLVWLVNETGRISLTTGRRIIVSFANDITAQREAEAAAASRLIEIEALYNSTPLGLALFDRDLKALRINDALAEINGVPAADHIGRFIFDIVPDLREQAEPMLRRVLETGVSINNISFSGETAREPGVQRDWLEHFHPVKTDAGEVIGVGVVCEEVTGRRAAERQLAALMSELRRTLHLFRVSLRAADVCAFALDQDRRFVWVSEGPWGQPIAEMLGKRDEEIFPESRWRVAVPVKEKVLAGGGQETFDTIVEVDGQRRVQQVRIEAMRDDSGAIMGLVGACIDITERQAHEAHVESLMRELAHRSKNFLAVIQGLARHSARTSGSLDVFLASFMKRLDGLARAQDLLIGTSWQGVGLAALIDSQIGHVSEADRARVHLDGPEIELNPRAVQNLGMALHELSTNASKYGSLSQPGGHVDVHWGLDAGEPPAFTISWIEREGPRVAPPTRKGFGHVVIRDLAARALMGEVSLDYAEEGLRWSLTAPKSCVVADQAPEARNES